MQRPRRAVVVGALLILAGVVMARYTDRGAGLVVRNIPIGSNPAGLIIDTGLQRALIANGAGISILDTRSGQLARTVPLRGVIWGVDPRNGIAFIMNVDNNAVTLLDARRGTIVRTAAPGSDAAALGVSGGTGRLFVVGYHGRVYVLDTRTYPLHWTSTAVVSTNPRAIAVDTQRGHVIVVGTGTYYHNYVASYGNLSVLDARSGALLRTVATQGDMLAVAEHTNRVFVVNSAHYDSNNSLSGSGSVSVFDATTWRLVDAVIVGNNARAMAVDERTGRVFVVSDAGVSMLDATSGHLLRTIHVASFARAVAVDVRHGRAFIVSARDDGTGAAPASQGVISVLNARDGTVLRTAPVGVSPRGVGVDERSELVFVVNGGGTVSEPDAWGWIPPAVRRWLPFLPVTSLRARPVSPSVNVLDLSR